MNKPEFLSRFLQDDGRTVIVPIDHGTAIPVPGLESPAELIDSLNPYADGYVVNLGAALGCSGALEGKGICLRTDIYKPPFGENPDHGSYLVYSMDEALEVGAHAVMNMCYPHHPNEPQMFRECAELISQSQVTGIPVILESLPFGIGRADDYTVDNIGFAVRAAAELGADIVKTAYPGDRDGFEAIVKESYVPVIVLGGAATDDAGILRMVADAISAGAAGVAIGRNVWQHENPVRMAKALHAIVHENASAESAADILKNG
ncbi:MAG: DhnA family fructose-bisphosphate aldolase class Ia [Verrucomicrobiales bacterium]|jgi:DhnA family fructose-bisphosphate aldolase class Ia